MNRGIDGEDHRKRHDDDDQPGRHPTQPVLRKRRTDIHRNRRDHRGQTIDHSPKHLRHLIGGSLPQRPRDELRRPALDLSVEDDVSAQEGADDGASYAGAAASASGVDVGAEGEGGVAGGAVVAGGGVLVGCAGEVGAEDVAVGAS
mmetsp:Transcript_16275/g.34172  ORF Transcript_16275/g.34172 Transcript_16275/m.34172 type:complete len:146 (-) Transcript_16275:738-1175(-)